MGVENILKREKEQLGLLLAAFGKAIPEVHILDGNKKSNGNCFILY